MTEYVVGFLFGPSDKAVALIRKNRPDWQKGLLNGIGGKIEPGESPYNAMVREFKEETGLFLGLGWTRFACLKTNHDSLVYFFFNRSKEIYGIESKTDEHVDIYSARNFARHGSLPNLSWLIPMALSFSKGEKCRWFDIQERDL